MKHLFEDLLALWAGWTLYAGLHNGPWVWGDCWSVASGALFLSIAISLRSQEPK